MRSKTATLTVTCTAIAAAFLCLSAAAQSPAPLDAAASDPAVMGWMKGAPPPADKTIQRADASYYKFPQTRWSFSNWSQFMPTHSVWRGEGAVAKLSGASDGKLEQLHFKPMNGGQDMTVAQALAAGYTDSVVVLHKGKIAYERYWGVTSAHTQHIAMSVTKSFVGTLAATLIAEGKLDPKALVTQYIPELKESGFAQATVQDVLDMTSGVRFSENYADPKAEIWTYVRAGGILPRPADYSGPTNFYDFAKTVDKANEPGSTFAYQTVNSDVAGWLVRRVSGKNVGELLSERIWSKLGAERDGIFALDSAGNEFAGGGLNVTTRDLARFGEMMRLDGRYNGQVIVPKAAVDSIRAGGNREVFATPANALLKGWSYKDMWWISHDDHGAYMARGVHGQAIYIDPKAQVVIARFASHPAAANSASDPVMLPMYRAISDELMQH
ncbi:serine hydrolase [Variovorax dokdonensis]|uniref:Serine hydrolase n=1 Tax=Variovorax dokdonensis TaxID=344883 RepID=A0ABT7ND37_9BURK|nr:serine hydrolase [Variovorax dokdonensis]MDM0045869.1 serine hydrolase [Variovorax dokdonensis]